MFYFTADEHYGHAKIMGYCNRPFKDVEEMDSALIANHNRVVFPWDVTIHAGDFCWARKAEQAQKYIRQLNGSHIFLKGSHDSWLPASAKFMWHKVIEGQFVVVCHYAMRTWEGAHHGSWQLYGHSHCTLPPIGKQMDVGVDGHNFTPWSWTEICQVLGEPNED